ncbi:MAG: polysaccharide ABC transporter ATP-binding protein [Shewanella sp.]|uniref:ABC transporter ATP-binding protein n=1 Tax=Aeromonas veronii TaxID=654 RepID=UPI002666252B|nr:ABC transporter ATP-binding protein [Aeromonas veronii]MDO2434761.1 ABC transporter ATP-binding protein [Aeromonas veronii]
MSFSISVKNLSKKYSLYETPGQRLLDIISGGRLGNKKDFYALKNFSLDIKKGQSVGILGRNGAGKSTLLQLLSGILTPTDGTVSVNGRVSALLELGAGFNPEFTGRENIALSAMIYDIDLEKNPEKINSIINFADIGDFIDQPVKTYSSGMYVRLAFAISSQVDPDILIVDEALSVGDLKFQSKCLRLIESLRDKGCTFIFVSHSPRMIELFCDRAIWLESGRVTMDGPPKNVVRAYENYMVGGVNEPQSKTELNAIKDPDGQDFTYFDNSYHIEKNGDVNFIRGRMQINGSGATHIDSMPFSFNVELFYQSNVIINKPLWAIGIFNELNQPVIHYNVDNDNVIFDGDRVISVTKDNSEEKIQFTADIPCLRPGDYLIAIGLDDGVPGNSTVIKHIYDAFKISISSTGLSPQAGYVQLKNCKINAGT